jgi:hypothetical protein
MPTRRGVERKPVGLLMERSASSRVSNHEAALDASFETRPMAAPQDEGERELVTTLT